MVAERERFCRDAARELVDPVASWLVERLIKSVHDLLPLLTVPLHQWLDADLALCQQVVARAVKQGIAGSHVGRGFAASIARQISYALFGKILFYRSRRRRRRPAAGPVGV